MNKSVWEGEYLKSQPFNVHTVPYSYTVVLIQQQKWENNSCFSLVKSGTQKAALANHATTYFCYAPIGLDRIKTAANQFSDDTLTLPSSSCFQFFLLHICWWEVLPHWSAARMARSSHVPHWSAARMVRSNHVPHWSAARMVGSNHVPHWSQRVMGAPVMSHHKAMNIFCCLMHRDLVCSSLTSRMALFPIGWERKSLLGLLSNHATR